MRVVKIAAHRGAITDRNGEPLAISTPVDSVWVNPQELNDNIDQLPKLARALKQDQQTLARRITSNLDREFLYLVRHMPPEQAAHVKALGIPGVYLLREYRRYYPAGEVTGHVVGFTTVDDKGQEGLELGFDQLLERRGRRQARDAGLVRPLRRERREHPRAAPGPRPRHQHRSAHSVSGLPRAEGGDAGISRARRLGDRHRCGHRRSAGDGESALVQPERSRAAEARPVPQPRRHRHFRAGLERQALHHGRGAGLGPVQARQRGRHLARDSSRSATRWRRTSTILGVDRSGHHPRQVQQRRHRQDRAVAAARANLEHAHRLGVGPGHRQQLSGRIGRHAEQLLALASHRHRHAVAWLRPVGDAAAARACLRDHRRRRHQAAHLLRAGLGPGAAANR